MITRILPYLSVLAAGIAASIIQAIFVVDGLELFAIVLFLSFVISTPVLLASFRRTPRTSSGRSLPKGKLALMFVEFLLINVVVSLLASIPEASFDLGALVSGVSSGITIAIGITGMIFGASLHKRLRSSAPSR